MSKDARKLELSQSSCFTLVASLYFTLVKVMRSKKIYIYIFKKKQLFSYSEH